MGAIIVECRAEACIDFDSVSCELPTGHSGRHSMKGDGPRILWEFADDEDAG